MDRIAVPTSPEGVVDPAWLTQVLGGVADGKRIIAAERVESSKTLAEKLRFAVTLEAPGGARRMLALCAKAHLDGSPGLDIIPEALFYRDLAPRLDVRVPHVFYAEVDEEAGQAIILMEDVVANGGRFMSPHHPYSVEITRETLAQLARLHASTWAGALAQDLGWLGPRIGAIARVFSTDMLQGLLDDGRAEGAAPEFRDAGNLLEALTRMSEHEETCVLHGDTHSGNTYLDAEGRPCWLDWQVVQRGNWSTDVSYHLSTVLTVDDRRAHEADLLRHYLGELEALGAAAPTWEQAWDLYRRSFCYGYLLWVITRVRGRDEVLAHMPRIAAAMADHDTYRRLGVIR